MPADTLLAELGLVVGTLRAGGCVRAGRGITPRAHPGLSPGRIRRRTEIALVVILFALALVFGCAMMALIDALADGFSASLIPWVHSGDVRALLMTLPLA